jgi:HK97 family phage major capsid protein
LEALQDRPRGASGENGSSDEREHKSKFLDWVRRPRDHSAKHVLGEAESELSKKSIAIGTGAGGGYAVPTLIAQQIESRVTTLNPFRQLVEIVSVGTSDFKKLISKNSAGSGWASEAGARSETATSDLVQCAPTFGVLYAYAKASEEAMQDVFFDVGAWLAQEAADGFASAEATAIWSGNGTARPSGLTNTTPTSADDGASPERAATALEYIATGSSPITSNPNMDDLIELAYSIKSGYLSGPGVGWVMNRNTARVIRSLKDTTNNYLWERTTQQGQPDMLLGYPVYMTDALPNIAANAFPVAFGNFRRGYVLADHAASGLRITVDESITSPGYTKFYIRKRVGGKVSNNECVKLLKCSAT